MQSDSATPTFKVIAESEDITRTIRSRLKHIRLTDEVGNLSDSVEIALSDHDPTHPIRIPPTGAELEIFIGYGERVRRMGLFVVDQVELSGYPGEMIISAAAAPFEQSKAGKNDLQSQKTRSWEAGITLGAMVNRIAGEHRMEPAVSPKLASIALPHTDQVSESDMNLLHRIAKRYDASMKPAGGKLVVVPVGEAMNAPGEDMPRVTLTPKDGSAYRVTIASRESAGTCIAYYRDIRAAQRRMVTIGEGEPVRRLRHAYRDSASAEAAARAELRKRARGEHGLSYTVPGRADLVAETLVTMSGFRDGVDGDWIVTRAEHYIGPNGYATTIDGVRPNSAEVVAAVNAAAADDQVQAPAAVTAA